MLRAWDQSRWWCVAVMAAIAPLMSTANEQQEEPWLHDFAGLSCTGCHWCPSRPDDHLTPRWSEQAPAGRFDSHVQISEKGIAVFQISQSCLACHDGGIGRQPPYANDPLQSPRVKRAVNPPTVNHHPYAIEYDPEQKPWLAKVDEVEAAGLKLFPVRKKPGSHTIECPSCHEVHQSGAGPLLRLTARNNVLCFACHRQIPGPDFEQRSVSQLSGAQRNGCAGCHAQ